MKKKNFIISILLLSFALGSLSYAQQNKLRRFAIVIGANNGGSSRVRLRYAVKDAGSVAKIFKNLGGVENRDVFLLKDPSPDKILRTLNAVRKKVQFYQKKIARIEVFFYYSGHADETGLLLAGRKLSYQKLRRSIKKMPADLQISILDSCSSGSITRAKGGKRRAPFLADESMKMKGYAFLTSSSYDEISQESDQIKSSFFTYYLISGLRGAADLSQDGRVTLNEVYQYAFHETLSKTEKAGSGTQHPGYEIQMSGSGDVVITDLRQNTAQIYFPKGMEGVVSIRNSEGVFIAELRKANNKVLRMGLDSGTYQILLRNKNKYYETKIRLKSQKKLITLADMKETKAYRFRGKGEEKEYRKKSFAFFLVPQIKADEKDPYRWEHAIQFNLSAGYSDKLNGLALGFFNMAGEEADGAMIGLINHVDSGGMDGAQLGIVNYSKSDVSGLQFSSFANLSSSYVSGVQASAGYNQSKGFSGLQTGLLNLETSDNKGMDGVQLGIFNMASSEVEGLQLSLVNVALKKVKGFQIGLVNISDDTTVPIGLVNVIKNGKFEIVSWVDVFSSSTIATYVGIKTGSKYFYSILAGGAISKKDIDTEIKVSAFGIGAELPIGAQFFVNLEFLAQSFHELSGNLQEDIISDIKKLEGLYSFRLNLGFRFTQKFAISAGLGYRFAYINDGAFKIYDYTDRGESFKDNFFFSFGLSYNLF